MHVLLIVAIFLLVAGCHHPRYVYLPETEAGQPCLTRCQQAKYQCFRSCYGDIFCNRHGAEGEEGCLTGCPEQRWLPLGS